MEGKRNVAAFPGRRATSPYPLNIGAYDDYLKGRSYVSKESKDGAIKGKELLERSIQQDPNYAPAFAALALAHYTLAFHSPPGKPSKSQGQQP